MKYNLFGNGKVMFGMIVLGFFVLLALVGPWFTSTVLGLDARANDISAISSPPSAAHPLGTTQFGQDVLRVAEHQRAKCGAADDQQLDRVEDRRKGAAHQGKAPEDGAKHDGDTE